MTKSKDLGIYVHIPFCVRKCAYCDFVSFPAEEDVREAYVSRLIGEIRASRDSIRTASTIFFGGGTPSLLSTDQLGRILSELPGAGEVSLEANPGTFDISRIKEWKELGFNRLSIGVQSFDDRILSRLGRIHGAEAAETAVRAAAEAGINTNLDLIFGVPEQAEEDWIRTLEKACSLGASHISAYSLQLEEGTRFYEEYRYGDLELPSRELDRRMYHDAVAILADHGYRRYEISNFARPGFECRHNLGYWTMKDYIGFGLAAHSFMNGRRYYNTSDLGEYMAGASPVEDEDQDIKGDFVFTELRLTNGFSPEDYERVCGSAFFEDFPESPKRLEAEGYITLEGGRVALTDKGMDATNTVMTELLEELHG
jgi:oxygen-independent coproporphyrinogen-3 oxidase